ncbi:hypothetical protein [Amycolatopsis sp. PS_44_ISF1]|uniref:hypothetical protein n=1 Tax=Amycolatopsis sp. PS_44_ISF1 TaxID=2974917 RepID=UPI0028DD43D7|nr:hypothetical protein [Amycolatopsis sp. PS_44_ISF1]MDT8915798.1 hypothetical protein [Amycolatopsis sp. PS_44_ISF1]MDT8916265.1 hypothetical protein [Amycolatopsis sp. PS_44_ISF1]
MRDYTNILATESFLSHEEQCALIAAAQDVPCTVTTNPETGEETVTFGKTAASETALTQLVVSFTPLIRSMARTAPTLGYDEAEAICLERFMKAIREYDLNSELPFSRDIRTMLRFELSDKTRTRGVVAIKENVAARYLRLVQKHAGDVRAAYEECRTTPNGFDPSTFLAVHRAYGMLISLDIAPGDSDAGAAGDWNEHERILIDHMAAFEEDLANRDLVRWAFTKVAEREAQILRLRYGFDDLTTENLRSRAGFRTDVDDLVMSDREVAQCMGLALSSCNRYKREALATMRSALESLAAESD